jgi:DNA-binding NarL/FixJ family response regulator
VAATPPASAQLQEARDALARADWERARDLFQAALDIEPSAEALDGLGQACFWLGQTGEALESFAKAFTEYRRRGDPERAAYLAAIFLAGEYRIAGNASLASGWLGRAERLLEGVGECSARGWLHVEYSKRAADAQEEERHAIEALAIARRLNDADLETTALSHVALARISQGQVEEGFALLDETMATATAGEAEDPLAIGEACCIGLVACENVADVRRARDWAQTVVDLAERRNFVLISPWCRAIYASFLTATGRWKDAEREFERSLREYGRLPEMNHPRTAALAGLADLRIRQGRLEEAEQLLAGSEHRPAAVAPVVRLHLARGEIELATERVEQRLEVVRENEAFAAPLLALRGAVALAHGDPAAAREAIATLAETASRLRRDELVALAKVLAARAAQLAGDPVAAAELEAAVEEFARLEMPLEEGHARLELARAVAMERPHLAVEHARTALAAFERLGAARDADETAAVLRGLGAPGRPAPRLGGTLTKREQEVLALLGGGLSNADIASRLVISPKTAEHHVSRILKKLGLRSRAEAAAYAIRASVTSGEGGML